MRSRVGGRNAGGLGCYNALSCEVSNIYCYRVMGGGVISHERREGDTGRNMLWGESQILVGGLSGR